MALRKVKGNLERMFDKNLTDLVRGIRNNKENEVRPILFYLFKLRDLPADEIFSSKTDSGAAEFIDSFLVFFTVGF